MKKLLFLMCSVVAISCNAMKSEFDTEGKKVLGVFGRTIDSGLIVKSPIPVVKEGYIGNFVNVWKDSGGNKVIAETLSSLGVSVYEKFFEMMDSVKTYGVTDLQKGDISVMLKFGYVLEKISSSGMKPGLLEYTTKLSTALCAQVDGFYSSITPMDTLSRFPFLKNDVVAYVNEYVEPKGLVTTGIRVDIHLPDQDMAEKLSERFNALIIDSSTIKFFGSSEIMMGQLVGMLKHGGYLVTTEDDAHAGIPLQPVDKILAVEWPFDAQNPSESPCAHEVANRFCKLESSVKSLKESTAILASSNPENFSSNVSKFAQSMQAFQRAYAVQEMKVYYKK